MDAKAQTDGAEKQAHAEVRPGDAIVHVERRKVPRHSVDARAALRVVRPAVELRGRILNLSLSGCRFRADRAVPLGVYRRVEIEFALEGMPFRLAGVTQAIHDAQNVGIRFLDLSERKLEQLRQLMREIEAQKHGSRSENNS